MKHLEDVESDVVAPFYGGLWRWVTVAIVHLGILHIRIDEQRRRIGALEASPLMSFLRFASET